MDRSDIFKTELKFSAIFYFFFENEKIMDISDIFRTEVTYYVQKWHFNFTKNRSVIFTDFDPEVSFSLKFWLGWGRGDEKFFLGRIGFFFIAFSGFGFWVYHRLNKNFFLCFFKVHRLSYRLFHTKNSQCHGFFYVHQNNLPVFA